MAAGFFNGAVFSHLAGVSGGEQIRVAFAVTIALPIVIAATTLTHEAGHAAAGALLGFQVPQVEVGQGPRLLSVRPGRTRWNLRLVPFNGFTTAYLLTPVGWGRRWVSFLMAGPLASATLVALVLALHPRNTPVALGLLALWVLVGVAMLVSTLLPGPHSGRSDNDIVGARAMAAMSEDQVVEAIEADANDLVSRLVNSGEVSAAISTAETVQAVLPESDAVEALVIYALLSKRQVAPARKRLDDLAARPGLSDDLTSWIASVQSELNG